MSSQKDGISSFARRDIECLSLGKEVDISFQKRVGFSPKSEFLRPESLVPPFLVGSQSASMVRAYPSILQQFKENLNRKKVFFGAPHSLRFNNPRTLRSCAGGPRRIFQPKEQEEGI